MDLSDREMTHGRSLPAKATAPKSRTTQPLLDQNDPYSNYGSMLKRGHETATSNSTPRLVELKDGRRRGSMSDEEYRATVERAEQEVDQLYKTLKGVSAELNVYDAIDKLRETARQDGASPQRELSQSRTPEKTTPGKSWFSRSPSPVPDNGKRTPSIVDKARANASESELALAQLKERRANRHLRNAKAAANPSSPTLAPTQEDLNRRTIDQIAVFNKKSQEGDIFSWDLQFSDWDEARALNEMLGHISDGEFANIAKLQHLSVSIYDFLFQNARNLGTPGNPLIAISNHNLAKLSTALRFPSQQGFFEKKLNAKQKSALQQQITKTMEDRIRIAKILVPQIKQFFSPDQNLSALGRLKQSVIGSSILSLNSSPTRWLEVQRVCLQLGILSVLFESIPETIRQVISREQNFASLMEEQDTIQSSIELLKLRVYDVINECSTTIPDKNLGTIDRGKLEIWEKLLIQFRFQHAEVTAALNRRE